MFICNISLLPRVTDATGCSTLHNQYLYYYIYVYHYPLLPISIDDQKTHNLWQIRTHSTKDFTGGMSICWIFRSHRCHQIVTPWTSPYFAYGKSVGLPSSNLKAINWLTTRLYFHWILIRCDTYICEMRSRAEVAFARRFGHPLWLDFQPIFGVDGSYIPHHILLNSKIFINGTWDPSRYKHTVLPVWGFPLWK